MWLNRFCLGLAVIAAALLQATRSSAATPNEELAVPDPAVVMGRLENGLRYAIRQHPSHQKEVIYFYVEAGSLDEQDNERGIAHFVEHMAFNGSRNFPASTLIKTFENAGIGFGRDQNANTDYFGTTYILDIPNENSQKLDLGFRWLRDVADGLKIDSSEVERERGVVLSEYRLNLGPQKTLFDEKVGFLIPGMRSVSRSPIGLRETIEHADDKTLSAFYRRWYRPDNVIVVAVGDEPVDVMKARISEAFSGWKSPDARPGRAPLGGVDYHRTFATKSLSDPHVSTTVTLCRYSPKPPHQSESVGVHVERLADQIWLKAFDERMVRLSREDSAPFLSATASYDINYRTFGETCFTATTKGDEWKTAMNALAGEVRRLETYGITSKEFEAAKGTILADADASVASQATRAPEQMANSILYNIVEDETYDTPEEQRRIYRLALAKLDAAAVNAEFHRHWTEASPPLVFVGGPKPIADEDIAFVWKQALAAAPLSAPVDPVSKPWAYASFAGRGKVVKREVLTDPDFIRITFANGVIVNFKQTVFSKDAVDIQVLFGHGQAELPPGQIFDALTVSQLLFSGGYERNDINDVMALCEGRRCNANLSVHRDSFSLYGATRTKDLDLELQILTGLLAEPGFRPVMAKSMPTMASSFYRQLRLNPGVVDGLKLAQNLPEPHIYDLATEEHIANLRAEDMAALLRDPLVSDPLEVTIVGDVDEDTITEALRKSIGALPARRSREARQDAVVQRYSVDPPADLVAYHEGPKDQALVLVTWPLYIWTPLRSHEGRIDFLLTRMIQDALTERVRQKLGKSYSPSVATSLPRGGDQGMLQMVLATSPDAVDMVKAEALKIAAEYAGGAFTQAELEQARTPILEEAAKERTYNSWWLNTLNGSSRYPDKLASARAQIEDIKGIKLAELKAEAAKVLIAKPYVVTALPNPDATSAEISQAGTNTKR